MNKIFIVSSLILFFSGDVFAECAAQTRIDELEKQIKDLDTNYNAANEGIVTAWSDYHSICHFGDLAKRKDRKYDTACWHCFPEYCFLSDWSEEPEEAKQLCTASGKIDKTLLPPGVGVPIASEFCGKIQCGNAQKVFRKFNIGDGENETENRITRGYKRIGKMCSGKNPDKIDIVQAAVDECVDACTNWYKHYYVISVYKGDKGSLQDQIDSWDLIKTQTCGTNICDTAPNSTQCKCEKETKHWNKQTQQCCEDVVGGNVEKCKCVADLAYKWNDLINKCVAIGDPAGEGPPIKDLKDNAYTGPLDDNAGGAQTSTDDKTSTTGKGTSKSAGIGAPSAGVPVAGLGKVPGGPAKGSSWSDRLSSLYNPGVSNRPGGGSIVVAQAGGKGSKKEGSDEKDSAGIGKPKDIAGPNSDDIFIVVSTKYRNRYFSGLIGEDIKEKTLQSIKTKSSAKKPVIYDRGRTSKE